MKKYLSYLLVISVLSAVVSCGGGSVKNDKTAPKPIIFIDNSEIKISYLVMPKPLDKIVRLKMNAAEKMLSFIVKNGDVSISNYSILLDSMISLVDGTNWATFLIKKNTNVIMGPMVMPYNDKVYAVQMSVFIDGFSDGTKGIFIDSTGNLTESK